MTLAAEQIKAEKRLVWLFELELGYRIDDKSWTQAASPNTACWYMDHAAERKPARVRQLLRSTHAITTYTEKGSLADSHANASSWYYDAATGRLYVHTSAGDSPATSGKYYGMSHFWRRYVTDQFDLPDTVLDPGGRWIEPRLRANIPEFSIEVNEFTNVGVSQTWSAICLANADGALDPELAKYIWHMCLCYLKVSAKGDTIGNFVTVCRGRTGSIGWTEEQVEVRIEDQLKAEE